MKQHFDKLQEYLKNVAGARAEHKARLAKIEAQRGIYDSAYIERQVKEANSAAQNFNQAAYEKVGQMLADLTKAAIEKHAAWPNLESPKLAAALKIIELSKGSLEGETVRKIVDQFAGDTPSLKVLQQIFKSQGVKYDGGIDQWLYDPELAGDTLNQFAYESILRGGSLNSLSSAISKVARREGHEFPQVIDEAGSDAVLRAAAGLKG